MHSSDPFFEEMGEKLVVIGQEIEPSDFVNDRIDILAIDEKGSPVIIELKRAEQKLQLLQALSYAAMLADWNLDDFLTERMQFAKESVEEARLSISDHLAGVDIKKLNQTQRVILLAEQFDYALLKTAEWLSEKYGVVIRCYRMAYASDGTSEYLSCTCIYPPAEIAEQAVRVKRPSAMLSSPSESAAEILESITNPEVRTFFEHPPANSERAAPREIAIRIGGRRRYWIGMRRKHAYVWQGGRFAEDMKFWKEGLSQPEKVEPVREGISLRFHLRTARDFEFFKNALDNKLKSTQFDVGDDEEAESPSEEA